jgi:hypothetical protein
LKSGVSVYLRPGRKNGKKQGSTAEEMDWSLVKILGGITQKGNPPFDKQTPWPDMSRESRILVF